MKRQLWNVVAAFHEADSNADTPASSASRSTPSPSAAHGRQLRNATASCAFFFLGGMGLNIAAASK